MRLSYFPLILFLTACAAQDIGPSSGKARFSEYPETLFAAFQASCTGPTREFLTTSPSQSECKELMPPDITAAFILEYSGTPEDLPRLVIRFRAQDDGDSFLVTNDVYVNVPQRSGGPRQVPFQNRALRQELDLLYLNAGGTPEA